MKRTPSIRSLIDRYPERHEAAETEARKLLLVAAGLREPGGLGRVGDIDAAILQIAATDSKHPARTRKLEGLAGDLFVAEMACRQDAALALGLALGRRIGGAR